ncbi:Galactose binding lectin-like protein [Sarcoptes scabiei]|uniref:Galactose binding lectin-like protein n=1 Tax=Sarcoptes scabiei TaxID=52283 RepID=A0A132A1K3_SARSC|nr:Galactose binding lectin-like protein [Sarcoptes scabiei]
MLTKTLRTFQIHACDNEEVAIECDRRSVVKLVYANYGKPVPKNSICRSDMLKKFLDELRSANETIELDLDRNQIDEIRNRNYNRNLESENKSIGTIDLSTNLTQDWPQGYGFQTRSSYQRTYDRNCSDADDMDYNFTLAIEEACRGQYRCGLRVHFANIGLLKPPCDAEARKFAEVAYKCLPKRYVEQVGCYGKHLDLFCSDDDRLLILSATFGATPYGASECPNTTTTYHSPRLPDDLEQLYCVDEFATKTVMRKCHAKKRCTLFADYRSFAEPDCKHDVNYYLKVIYTCSSRTMIESDLRFLYQIPDASTTPFPKLRKKIVKVSKPATPEMIASIKEQMRKENAMRELMRKNLTQPSKSSEKSFTIKPKVDSPVNGKISNGNSSNIVPEKIDLDRFLLNSTTPSTIPSNSTIPDGNLTDSSINNCTTFETNENGERIFEFIYDWISAIIFIRTFIDENVLRRTRKKNNPSISSTKIFDIEQSYDGGDESRGCFGGAKTFAIESINDRDNPQRNSYSFRTNSFRQFIKTDLDPNRNQIIHEPIDSIRFRSRKNFNDDVDNNNNEGDDESKSIFNSPSWKDSIGTVANELSFSPSSNSTNRLSLVSKSSMPQSSQTHEIELRTILEKPFQSSSFSHSTSFVTSFPSSISTTMSTVTLSTQQQQPLPIINPQALAIEMVTSEIQPNTTTFPMAKIQPMITEHPSTTLQSPMANYPTTRSVIDEALINNLVDELSNHPMPPIMRTPKFPVLNPAASELQTRVLKTALMSAEEDVPHTMLSTTIDLKPRETIDMPSRRFPEPPSSCFTNSMIVSNEILPPPNLRRTKSMGMSEEGSFSNLGHIKLIEADVHSPPLLGKCSHVRDD